MDSIAVKHRGVARVTHPAWGDEALDADQVPLQLCQLLEVLQPDQNVLERGGHLCDDLEGICVKRPLSTGTQAGGPGVAQAEPSPHHLVTGAGILKGTFNSRSLLLQLL